MVKREEFPTGTKKGRGSPGIPIASRAGELARMRGEQRADRARERFLKKKAELEELIKKREEERLRGGAPKPPIAEDILKIDVEDKYTP